MINIFILIYRIFISPIFVGLGCECRFYPTCSEYAKDAFNKYSFGKAFSLAVWRLLRCGPWHRGGVDPVV